MNMVEISERISELMYNTDSIVEMIGIAAPSIDVQTDPRIDIATITADDDDPKFVIVEVIRAGMSKTNNRNYNNEIVDQINSMVPGLQGFCGHPDPNKAGFEFRKPECVFVGSTLDIMPDGVHRCIAKAYLFKSSDLREWIPKSIAAGNPMTVSINGIADIIRFENYIEVVRIKDMLSIDWANPGTEGMGTSQAITIVNEMQNNNSGGNKNMDPVVTAKEILTNVSVSELKAYGSKAVDTIIGEISITEFQAKNPKLYDAIKETGKITEMQLTIGGKTEAVKITELQSIISGLEGTIATAKSEAEEAKLTEFRNSAIAAKVPEGKDGKNTMREKIMARIPVKGMTEAKITEMVDAEIAYIREMGGFDNMPAPRQSNHDLDTDKLKDQVAGLFGVKQAEKK